MKFKLPDVEALVAGQVTEDPQPLPLSCGEYASLDPSSEPASKEAEAASDSRIPPGETLSGQAGHRAGTIDETRFLELSGVLIAHTAPWSPSTKWDFLGGELGERIEMSPPDFIESLENKFGKTVLTELGLQERVGDELRLPSWIVEGAVAYVTIDKENRTFKFQAIHQPEFPRVAIDYAQVRATEEFASAPQTLFVADSEDSADILRRLGMQSVSCNGLESLGKCDVDKIFGAGHDHPSDWRYYLLLVDFDVACLQNKSTGPIGEVIKRLSDAEEAYRIDPAQRFGVCRPDTDEFQMLEKLVAFKDVIHVARLFERWSMVAKATKVSSWRSYIDVESATFFAVRAELQRAILSRMPFALEKVKTALSRHRDAYRRLIRQRGNDFESAADIHEKIEMVAAVGLAEAFFEADPLVKAAEYILEYIEPPPQMSELRKEALEEQMRYMAYFRSTRIARKGKR